MRDPVDRQTLEGERSAYRVYEEVGKGGAGSVLYGRDVRSNRAVAVKRLLPQHAHETQIVQRFEQEAKLVLDYGLVHPNIVRIVDRGRDADGVPFLVMEWVEGWTAADLLYRSGGTLQVGAVAGIACQSLEGLAAAHRRNVIHRDVKPANLMVDRFGQVRVMDLGIAKVTDSDVMTVTTMFAPLTFAYAAPEQMAILVEGHAQAVDARTDLYSLGATLYALLSGSAPFAGMARPVLPDLHHVRPDVDASLAAAIQKALKPEPSARFQSALEMQAVLRPYAPADFRVDVGQPRPPTHADAVALAQQYAAGCRAADAEDWDAALRHFSAVERLDPEYLDNAVRLRVVRRITEDVRD